MSKRLILTAALVLTVAGATAAQDFSTGDSVGTLTVYRPGAPLESLPSVTHVVINQDVVLELRKEQYVTLTLDHGEYLLYFSLNLVGADTAGHEAYLVEVAEGQAVFVNVVIESLLTRNLERVHSGVPDLSGFTMIADAARLQEPNR